MLKDEDRIFKNLYNDLGADLNSAKKRGDWKNTNEICEKYKSKFKEKLNTFNIKEYSDKNPFTNSCNALFHWGPIADELKELDKEIVINSIKNKWMLVVADFEKIPVNLNN